MIIHTVSSSDYWQGRMSLDATDPTGRFDLHIPERVRTDPGDSHLPRGARLSLEERYGDHAGDVAAVRAAAARLVADRLLLQVDADAPIAQADASTVLR
jgi:hypothetical protein